MRKFPPNNFVLGLADRNNTVVVPSGNTIVLPNPNGLDGAKFTIKRVAAGSPVTVTVQAGAQPGTIDPPTGNGTGAASFSINVQGMARTFECDGIDYYIVASYL